MRENNEIPAKLMAPKGHHSFAGKRSAAIRVPPEGHMPTATISEIPARVDAPKGLRLPAGKRSASDSMSPNVEMPTATISEKRAASRMPKGRKESARDDAGPTSAVCKDRHMIAGVVKPIPRKRVSRAVSGETPNVYLPDSSNAGPMNSDIRLVAAGSGIDPVSYGTHYPNVDPALINQIRSLFREHRSLQQARGDMDRRIRSAEHWEAASRMKAAGVPIVGKLPEVTAFDKLTVINSRPRLFAVRDSAENNRKACLKELTALGKRLPVVEWAAGVKGLGISSVMAIVGEAGDLGLYANPGKLWKRMGLAVINGKSQRKVANETAVEQGYSPRRRSEMHVIGDCLVRAGDAYADLYRERKAYELTKDGITLGHAHKRALRYIEKRLLRAMWQAWRGAKNSEQPYGALPPADLLAAE